MASSVPANLPPARASVPVVTDATAASDAELREAAAHFLESASLRFTRTAGGVNNRVYYVEDGEGSHFVLRIYNNGENLARVVYEHAVLTTLAERLAAAPLPFEVPSLIPVRPPISAGSTATAARIASGAHACLFRRIPGGAATLSAAGAIGRATAGLVSAMASLRVPLALPNPLYRNLYDAHHTITRESFLAGMALPVFDAVRADAAFLVAAIDDAEAAIVQALACRLPEQQIHADLHFDNVLVADGAVSAVLDFEFSAFDWRVMELAVGLSKYVGQKDIEPVFVEWVDGYKAGGGLLTADEATATPDLIIVRILSNVIYFAGRALAGEDTWECLTGRVGLYANRIRWIRERQGWMIKVLSERLVLRD